MSFKHLLRPSAETVSAELPPLSVQSSHPQHREDLQHTLLTAYSITAYSTTAICFPGAVKSRRQSLCREYSCPGCLHTFCSHGRSYVEEMRISLLIQKSCTKISVSE